MNAYKFDQKRLVFIVIFGLLGLLALQIHGPLLAGSKAGFTLFDFFGPIAPAFIGTIPGLVMIFLVQLLNFLIHGAQILDVGTIIRFFPPLAAGWYFTRSNKFQWILPLIAIAVFNLNPIGLSVWYYSLFWTIPLFCYFVKDKLVFFKALGATFSAHAVGGALWIYAFRLPKSVWVGLIPTVIYERLLFAAGITVAYLAVRKLVNFLATRRVVEYGKI